MPNFLDALTLDGGSKPTAEGYLVVTPRVARANNIQLYLPSELGDTFKDSAKPFIRVYRPEAEVFSRDAIKSYAHVPVTIGHPDENVSAENWKTLAVGDTGADVIRDGEYVRVSMMVRDKEAIDKVKGGERELSMGYSAQIVAADGKTVDGRDFDAIMSNFRMNHIAIVPGARGGSDLRIGDAKPWGLTPITDQQPEREPPMADLLQTIVIGDKAVQVSATDAATIDSFKRDMKDANVKMIADHASVVAAKDAEIGKLTVELKAAKDAAAVDVGKLVADRVALEAQVLALDSAMDTKGKKDDEIKKELIAKKMGADAVKDASPDKLNGMFEALIATAAPVNDSMRDALKSYDRTVINSNDAWPEAAFKSAGVAMRK